VVVQSDSATELARHLGQQRVGARPVGRRRRRRLGAGSANLKSAGKESQNPGQL
jgi:hypothetical protein